MSQWFDDQRKVDWEWEHDSLCKYGLEEKPEAETEWPIESSLEFGPDEPMEYDSVHELEDALRRCGKLPADGLQRGRDYEYI